MKWTELVPSEFKNMIQDGRICVLPVGALERHGEHIPFGCDLDVVETIAAEAAVRTPAVVFPGYFLAQVHEAACFSGTVNLPAHLTIEVLSHLLDSIAANGFKKILILNGHGGNQAFLDYFSMSQLDEPRDYVLYWANAYHIADQDKDEQFNSLWESDELGHACEMETSIYMACCPDKTRMDLADLEQVRQPVKAKNRLAHLQKTGVHNAHWWYADYPQNVVESPGLASLAKGEKALELMIESTAEKIKAVQDDRETPRLQKEFLDKVIQKGKGSN